MEKISVVVADGNAMFRRNLRNYLSLTDDIVLVGAAENGRECLNMINKLKPDVLILDNTTKELDGVGILQNLQHVHKTERPCIIFDTEVPTAVIMRIVTNLEVDYVLTVKGDFKLLADRIRLTLKVHRQLNEPVCKNVSKEAEVTLLLRRMGVSAKYKGYNYIKDAVLTALDNTAALNNLTKQIYNEIAEKYKASVICIERNMRSVITNTWASGNMSVMKEVFASNENCENKKSTNGEFISAVTSYINQKS